MSHTRLSADREAYQKAAMQSAAHGHYMLQTPRICSDASFFPQVMQGQNAGVHCRPYSSASLTDLDSELMGIDRKLSHCRPVPDAPMLQADILSAPLPAGCSPAAAGTNTFLTNENTRMTSAGACTLRGTGINRFDFPLTDPQAVTEAQAGHRAATHSRMLMKDSFRPCVSIPMVDSTNGSGSDAADMRAYDTITDVSRFFGRSSESQLPSMAPMPARNLQS